MKIFDRIALFLAIATFFAASYFSINVYEGIPHIEDEITYVWQARLAAAGKIAIQSPVCPECFLEPFVIDRNGIRFGKYPPGWPAALSLGIRLGVRDYVNPFFSALYIWLAYLLVKKLFNPVTGLIATVLTVVSPFFLINSGTLLAHPWSLLLVVVFAHGWHDTLNQANPLPKWLTGATAALSMGLLILTRPLTAVGICLPFFIHGIYMLIKGSANQRWAVISIGAAVLLVGSLYVLWQYRVTGDPFTNPYTLYWPYDRVGFSAGIGLHPDGHQLKYALVNTRFSLQVGNYDLFGWTYFSWIFLPFGLIPLVKRPNAWPVAGVFFSLVLAYMLYWIGAWTFGPRYYYEGLISLTTLSAAGIAWLAGIPRRVESKILRQRLRFAATGFVLLLLMAGNLIYYLPQRTASMRGLYGIEGSQLLPFRSATAQSLTPALVIVHPEDYWLEYGALLDLSHPLLDTPFIFTFDRGPQQNRLVMDAYPDRTVIYYNPSSPYTLVVSKKTPD